MEETSKRDQQISLLLEQKDEKGIIALLEEGRADGDYVLTYHPTGERFPLLFAAIERNWTELALWLVGHGADANLKDHGITALMDACLHEDHRVIEELIARGAKLDVKSPRGGGETDDTALMIAAERHDLWAVERLLRAGADAKILNHKKQSAIHYALEPRPRPHVPDIVRSLLRAGCPLLGTELHFPVFRRDVAMTRLLLDHGVPLDAAYPHDEYAGPKKGETPLTTAVRWQHSDTTDAPEIGLVPTAEQQVEIEAILLAAGAGLDVPGPKGWTPLMIAVGQKHRPLAQMLLRAGADPNLAPAGPKGESAAALATRKGLDEFVAILKERS